MTIGGDTEKRHCNTDLNEHGADSIEILRDIEELVDVSLGPSRTLCKGCIYLCPLGYCYGWQLPCKLPGAIETADYAKRGRD